jgi:hypothetical protein
MWLGEDAVLGQRWWSLLLLLLLLWAAVLEASEAR